MCQKLKKYLTWHSAIDCKTQSSSIVCDQLRSFDDMETKTVQKPYPSYVQNGRKTISFEAVHTYMAHIREYSHYGLEVKTACSVFFFSYEDLAIFKMLYVWRSRKRQVLHLSSSTQTPNNSREKIIDLKRFENDTWTFSLIKLERYKSIRRNIKAKRE